MISSTPKLCDSKNRRLAEVIGALAPLLPSSPPPPSPLPLPPLPPSTPWWRLRTRQIRTGFGLEGTLEDLCRDTFEALIPLTLLLLLLLMLLVLLLSLLLRFLLFSAAIVAVAVIDEDVEVSVVIDVAAVSIVAVEVVSPVSVVVVVVAVIFCLLKDDDNPIISAACHARSIKCFDVAVATPSSTSSSALFLLSWVIPSREELITVSAMSMVLLSSLSILSLLSLLLSYS